MAKNCSKILNDLRLQYLDYSHDHLTLGQNFAKILRKLEDNDCDQYLDGKVNRLRQGWTDSLIVAETDHLPFTKPDPWLMDRTLANCNEFNNCSHNIHEIGNSAAKRLHHRVDDLCGYQNKLLFYSWIEWIRVRT